MKGLISLQLSNLKSSMEGCPPIDSKSARKWEQRLSEGDAD